MPWRIGDWLMLTVFGACTVYPFLTAVEPTTTCRPYPSCEKKVEAEVEAYDIHNLDL